MNQPEEKHNCRGDSENMTDPIIIDLVKHSLQIDKCHKCIEFGTECDECKQGKPENPIDSP